MKTNVDKQLMSKILKACNEIHNKSTKSGFASFIITNPQVAQAMNDIYKQHEKRKLREKKIKRIIYEKDNNDTIDTN